MEKVPAWLWKTIAGLVALVLLFVAISQFYVVKSKVTATDNQHTINITAEGKVSATPDLATINASVLADGNTAVEAQNAATKDMNKAIDFVKNKGVAKEDIQTSGFNVYPKYDYTKGDQKIIGYTANETVTIKVHKLDTVGDLLDGLTQNGVNQIQGATYGFDDPENLRQQAREQALQQAREKAQKLASAAGVSLGKLVSFSEANVGYPIPMAYDAMKSVAPAGMGMGGGGSTPNVEPGTQDITAQVSVIYELK